jgi:RND family efflux transporter MFP subunit
MANSRATVLSALTVAKGDIERSQAEVAAARISLERAEQLLQDKAGSQKAVDDARALLNVSEAMLRAAQAREQELQRLAADIQGSDIKSNNQARPIAVTSPQSGIILNLTVTQGQPVNSGMVLFEVADTTTMWIRAPIYVGLLPEVQTSAEAHIVDLAGRPSFEPRIAQPVNAPPTADPQSATADLYFETDNRDKELRPGQRVAIELPLNGQDARLVVSAKSLLYDIYGSTWVYVVVDDRSFERQRVSVDRVVDGRAVLTDGPQEGTRVVVDGAAELFGTEFGIGK